MNFDDREKLAEIQNDNAIWGIYIFIVVAALFSNEIEKKFILTRDKNLNQEFHIINMIVLTLAFFIYLYFLNINSKRFDKKKDLNTFFSLAGTTLLLASGALLLIAEIRSSASDSVELGL